MSRHEKVTLPPKNDMKHNSFWYLYLEIYLYIADTVIHNFFLPNQAQNPPRQARFHFLCPDMRIRKNPFNDVLNKIEVF